MLEPRSPEVFDRVAILEKYHEERLKRLRPEGVGQYVPLEGRALDDPFKPVEARAPVQDHVTVAVLGGGFGGLIAAAALASAGLTDVRIVDRAGDFGGTWYWNRYPGAQCDTSSLVYLPFLEETGYLPTEKYAHAPEIQSHCRRIALQYGLYERALLHTAAHSAIWDEAKGCWTIATDRDDRFTAAFIVLATGAMDRPKLPGVPGIETFRGTMFHTSRWNYDYTGGDVLGAPMTRLADKRVAVIGTGASAVQCVPELAKACGELLVLQRTPSAVDIRNNGPIDPAWHAQNTAAGWQKRLLDNFADNQPGGTAVDDLVEDGWTNLFRSVRAHVARLPPEDRTQPNIMAAYEEFDLERMDALRKRIDATVHDKSTAARLKPWYRLHCKHQCFHDEYLGSFNRQNVKLIDTDGKGPDRFTRDGLLYAGREYAADCLVFASGFEVGIDYKRRAGLELTGVNGELLSSAFADGMKTYHGLQVCGFPNAFLVQTGQGANLMSNVPQNFLESGKTIAAIVHYVLDTKQRIVEPTREAQDAWIQLLLAGTPRTADPTGCTPGYFNNEGVDIGPRGRFFVGYPDGPSAYFRYIDEWRRSGTFNGLAFR